MLITFTTTVEHNVAIDIDIPSEITDERDIREYIISQGDADFLWLEGPSPKEVMSTAWCDLDDGVQIDIKTNYQYTAKEAEAKRTNSLPLLSSYS